MKLQKVLSSTIQKQHWTLHFEIDQILQPAAVILQCLLTYPQFLQYMKGNLIHSIQCIKWFLLKRSGQIISIFGFRITMQKVKMMLPNMINSCTKNNWRNMGKECNVNLFFILVFFFRTLILNMTQWICICFHLFVSLKSSWQILGFEKCW